MRMSLKEKQYLRSLILANLDGRTLAQLCMIVGVDRTNLWRFANLRRVTADYSLIVMLEDILPPKYAGLIVRPSLTTSPIERFIQTGELP